MRAEPAALVFAWVVQATLVGLATCLAVRLGHRWSPLARHALLAIGLAAFVVPPVLPLGRLPWAIGQVAPDLDVPGTGVRTLLAAAAGPWLGTAMAVWLTGLLGLLAALAVQAVALRRTRARSRPPGDGALVVEAARLARELGMRRPPRLLLSPDARCPFVCGAWAPTIVLPDSLAGRIAPASLRYVLAHELAHLRQRDLWLNWVRSLACVVWWPHPLVWSIAKRSRQAREESCDDLAAAALGVSPGDCARGLVEAAAASRAPRRVPLLAIGGHATEHLDARLERLLDPAARRARALSGRQRAAVFVFAVAAFSGAAVAVPSSGSTDTATSTATVSAARVLPTPVAGPAVARHELHQRRHAARHAHR